MDNEINEQDQIRYAVQIKKERFRIEIRKSKNKEEFAMKRIKLMQEKDIVQKENIFVLNKQNFSLQKEVDQINSTQVNYNENQSNIQSSFYNYYESNYQRQSDVQDQMNSYSQYRNSCNYEFQETDFQIDEDILALLEEFKSYYQDINSNIYCEKLCQIRKILTIASSEYDSERGNLQQSQRKQKNNRDGGNSNNHTMVLANNYHHPVFSTILRDQQFLNIILDILKEKNYKQLKEIQYECMWILINLCSGINKECLIMLNLGVLDTFKYLMEHCDDLQLLEHVCWCLGNLAADDAECREKLFEDSSLIVEVIQKFYEKLMKNLINIPEKDYAMQNQQSNQITNSNKEYLEDSLQYEFNQNSQSNKQNQINFRTIYEFVFFLTNLIKKHPMPRIDPLRKILQVLKELFFLDLPQIKLEIIKSFRILLMKSEIYLNEVLKLDIIKYIMPFLGGKNNNLIKDSIDLFIVIAQNCDEFTHKLFVQAKFQEFLEQGLNNLNRDIKRKGIEFIQTIINCSESLNIVAEILFHEKLLCKLLNMLLYEDFQIKQPIVSLLKDILESDMGIQKLINLKYIEILIRIGMCGCPKIEILVIQSLSLIFQYGETEQYQQDSDSPSDEPQNQILLTFFQNQGDLLIEQLSQSKSGEVNQMYMQLVKNYLQD